MNAVAVMPNVHNDKARCTICVLFVNTCGMFYQRAYVIHALWFYQLIVRHEICPSTIASIRIYMIKSVVRKEKLRPR